jgi:hypothetical protein
VFRRSGGGGGGETGGGGGASVMSETPKTTAQVAVTHVQDDAAALILELAQERAKAQHAGSISLDSRATQLVAMQFSATAILAAFSTTKGIPGVLLGLLSVSAIFFVIGGILAFRTIKSTDHYPPGLPPAWWADVVKSKEFTLRDARCWAAGAIQEMIDENVKEDRVRTDHLNLSIRYATAGAILFGIGMAIKIFY